MFNYFVDIQKNKSVSSIAVDMKSGKSHEIRLSDIEISFDKERKFVIFKSNLRTIIIDTNQVEAITKCNVK